MQKCDFVPIFLDGTHFFYALNYGDKFEYKSKLFKEGRKSNMAKDGTNRGGARPGAGRPRKALTEKISEGKKAEVMLQPAELTAADIPPVREFMTAMQRDGTTLCAKEVFTETYSWLKDRNCEKLVSRQLIEQYAMSISRWIHCEEVVSRTGYIAKHPTTNAPIASPYVAMSQAYLKQANVCWNQIFTIVRENCSVEFQDNPQDDMMEKLLRSRK
nr:MAG TPA: terminase small subunit [Caudoviricetes sp.]